MITWHPDPIIFQIGPVALRWYSLSFMVAFGLGFFLFKWMFKKEKLPQNDLETLFIYIFSGTVIGARLGHCLFYDPAYYFSHPLEIVQMWKGGLASHGTVIGILVAIYLFSRKYNKYHYLHLLDQAAIVVSIGGAFIRLGNLFNSEIIGKPTEVAWSFIFSKVDNIPRHPTQLYETFSYISIFLLLLYVYYKNYKNLPAGLLLGMFFFTMFLSRFFIEFFKENQSAFEAGWSLNMGQLLSIPLIFIGMGLMLRIKFEKSKTPKQHR